jgi:molecular chaperone DnaJ
VTVPTIDGDVELEFAAGTQPGEVVVLRGSGMPVLQGRGRGDMVVEIQVETPTKLSARQKELLAEFRATETGDECPQSKGFFDRLKSAITG